MPDAELVLIFRYMVFTLPSLNAYYVGFDTLDAGRKTYTKLREIMDCHLENNDVVQRLKAVSNLPNPYDDGLATLPRFQAGTQQPPNVNQKLCLRLWKR